MPRKKFATPDTPPSRMPSRNQVAKRAAMEIDVEGAILPKPMYHTLPDGSGVKFVHPYEPKKPPTPVLDIPTTPVKRLNTVLPTLTPEQIEANKRKAEVIRAFGTVKSKVKRKY